MIVFLMFYMRTIPQEIEYVKTIEIVRFNLAV